MFTQSIDGTSGPHAYNSHHAGAGFARVGAYPALTVLRDLNDRAAMFLIRLVARVGLEPTTSAL